MTKSTTPQKRRTLLPWMGGKSKLANTIISKLPVHTTYVEPFCGGCAVFFRKERSKVEILNDRDNRLITLLRVMRYHPDELLKELECLSHARQEFNDAREFLGWTDIQKAARCLLLIKSCFGARMRGPTFGYGLTGKAKFNQTDTLNIITAARERLDGVTIENLDFADVLARYDSPDTLFYCDPPYIDTEQYACEFTMADHARLRDALMRAKGRAIISLNDCAKVQDLYSGKGWHIEPVETTYSVGGKASDRAKRYGEVLIFRQ